MQGLPSIIKKKYTTLVAKVVQAGWNILGKGETDGSADY
jgi:hypothetical protein